MTDQPPQPRTTPPHVIHNIMQGTAEYVIQVGHLHGDVVVQLPPTADPVEQAVRALARAVRNQWRAEAASAGLDETLPVRWLAVPDLSPATSTETHGDQLGLMADAFLSLPHRRLVALGGPGSGKSTLAMLLTLELAERCLTRQTGQDRDSTVVPVIVPLESWDPAREHFHTWLARRIAEEYPGLPRIDGRHPATRLIQDQRLLPIVDGIDELPEHRQGMAVHAIDTALGSKDAIMLTSRTDEYRRMISTGAFIAKAATMEAQPVLLKDAATYLIESSGPHVHPQWVSTAQQLMRMPECPVSEALSNPLMIWLARQGYQAPGADPRELVNREFTSRKNVEEHLLDMIIPAVFTEHPHSPDRLHAPGQWDKQRARRWLSHIAKHLTRRYSTELAWWDLHRTLLVRIMALPTLIATCFGLWVIWTEASTWYATRASAGQKLPGLISAGTVSLLSTGLLGGVTMASWQWTVVSVWFGELTIKPRRRANPFRIGAALRSARRAVSVGRALRASAVVALPAIATAVAFALGSRHPLLFTTFCMCVLAPTLMVAIAAPSDTEDAATPDELLRGERRAALLTVFVIAPLLGGALGFWSWARGLPLTGTAMMAIATWFGASATLFLLSPWSRWLLAKAWLALAGRVPWSLMEFLADAHRGGLLQRSGGVYRFRHLRLQHHLVAPKTPRTHLPAPPSTTQTPTAWPPSSFRNVYEESMRSPLSSLKRWTVRDDENTFHAAGKERIVPLAHWPIVLLLLTIQIIRAGFTGEWSAIPALFLFALLLGLIPMLLRALVPVRRELSMTREYIAFRLGRLQGRLMWDDIQDVAIRKLIVRRRDNKIYAVQVRLRPGARPPRQRFRSSDGWYWVFTLSVAPVVPSDVADALTRFAGKRWHPPF